MHIKSFKTAWGVQRDDIPAFFADAKKKGYTGVELNPHFRTEEDLEVLRALYKEHALEAIIGIFSSWPSAVGPKPTTLTVDEHLAFYRRELTRAKSFNPVAINCQGGNDVWPIQQSIAFYRATIEIDAELGLTGMVFHESHRNRSLFSPFVTLEIVTALPDLRLTADWSHWLVVHEHLLDQNESGKAVIEKLVPFVHHIHARVGTTQNSQCPEPDSELYRVERAWFDHWWSAIVRNRQSTDAKGWTSFQPEYGPYPYHSPFAPRSNSEIADTERARLQKLFAAI